LADRGSSTNEATEPVARFFFACVTQFAHGEIGWGYLPGRGDIEVVT